MDILVSLDHNFLMPTCVMLKSLAVNNNDVDMHCHVVVDNTITKGDKNVLLATFADDIKRQMFFYDVSYGDLPNLPLPPNHSFSSPAYFRLFAASILPSSVDKVIYIDGDAIVIDSLTNLCALEIDNKAVAGVPDCNQSPSQYNRLGLKSKNVYINSGILLINLKYWREHDSERLFRKYLKENNPEYVDQDVLNCVFQNEKLVLPLQYNLTRAYYYKPQFAPFTYYDIKEDLEYARSHPVIVHFTGDDKPWLKSCLHPMRDEFLKYYRMTIWKDIPLKKKTISIKSLLKATLEKTGILSSNSSLNKYEDFINVK